MHLKANNSNSFPGKGLYVAATNIKPIQKFFSTSNGFGLSCKKFLSATDTVTNDPFDISSVVPTTRTHIQTANREYVSVDRAESVDISPSIHLNNWLLIPSLSHKMLSVSQLTKDLNCTLLMISDGCIV